MLRTIGAYLTSDERARQCPDWCLCVSQIAALKKAIKEEEHRHKQATTTTAKEVGPQATRT